MKLSKDLYQQLVTLEESLWREATRFDRQYIEKTLAPQFKEFGRSGRVYSRQECLLVEDQEIEAKLPLENLAIERISPDAVLLTYISEVGRDKLRANRSSIWIKSSGTWLLLFHQGTPAQ